MSTLIPELYNLSSFEGWNENASAFIDSSNDIVIKGVQPGQSFSDSGNGILLERELVVINQKIFRQKYRDLTFFDTGMSTDNTGGYARKVKSKKFSQSGEFVDASDKSSGKGVITIDLDTSEIFVTERTSQIGWSDSELAEAQAGNVNLVSELFRALNEQYNRELDKAGYVGINGNKGLLNFAGVTATETALDWPAYLDGVTAVELYNVMIKFITEQRAQAGFIQSYMANTLIMSPEKMTGLAGAMVNSAGSTVSVLTAIQEKFPEIKWVSTSKASIEGSYGTLTKDRMCLVNTDSNNMTFRLPVPLRIGKTIEAIGWNFNTAAKYRLAGLDLLELISVRYLDIKNVV